MPNIIAKVSSRLVINLFFKSVKNSVLSFVFLILKAFLYFFYTLVIAFMLILFSFLITGLLDVA
jgi:hypothetical protein